MAKSIEIRNLYKIFGKHPEKYLEAVIVRGEPMPQADLQIPLLSLPRLFDVRLDTIPCTSGYL